MQKELQLIHPIYDAKIKETNTFTDAKKVCLMAEANDDTPYVSWNEQTRYWSLWVRAWPGGPRPDYHFICRLTQMVAFELVDKSLAEDRFDPVKKARQL